eukprot:2299665-Pleurochrysis_carterae.AAC.2
MACQIRSKVCKIIWGHQGVHRWPLRAQTEPTNIFALHSAAGRASGDYQPREQRQLGAHLPRASALRTIP